MTQSHAVATGAYLAIVFSNRKMGTVQFGQGIPLMIAIHYMLLVILKQL